MMAGRTGHGAGKGSPRIEILPWDEQPVGVPAPPGYLDSPKAVQLREEIAAIDNRLAGLTFEPSDHGRFGSDLRSRLAAEKGGKVRALHHEQSRIEAARGAELARLATDLLPDMVVQQPDFATALPLAVEFIEHESAAMARDVGGGELPNGPASMLVSAGLQLAASRVMFARGEFKLASTLANDSRQNLAACHEYAVKRAQARKDANPQAAADAARAHFSRKPSGATNGS